METVRKYPAQNLERIMAGIVVIVPPIFTLIALVSLKYRSLTWIDALLFGTFYIVSALGITLGYHRLLTHTSFKCTRFLKKALTISAAMSIQGPAIWWVAHHRRHHAFSDREHDVHSPHLNGTSVGGKFWGFLVAHMGWMMTGHKTSARKFAGDLLNDPDILKIDKLYPVWALASLALPALLGGFLGFSATTISAISSGLSANASMSLGLAAVPSALLGGLLWGGFVRIFILHHVTWSVNSIGHIFGKQPFKTTDRSRNNALVAAFSLGEGWHNAHHAFPNSARHGLLKGEFDFSWECIHFLEKRGWIWDVKIPSSIDVHKVISADAQSRYVPTHG